MARAGRLPRPRPPDRGPQRRVLFMTDGLRQATHKRRDRNGVSEPRALLARSPMSRLPRQRDLARIKYVVVEYGISLMEFEEPPKT